MSAETGDDEDPRATRREILLASCNIEVWDRLFALVDQGAPADDLIEAVSRTAKEQAPLLQAELRKRAPEMLRQQQEARNGFLERLRLIWGDALDAMFAIYVAVEEIGANFQLIHGRESDRAFDVVSGLHARSCLVLLEVHALLSQGFPLGALARARTLYETAVVALVIQHAVRELDQAGIAERFADHWAIDARWDLKVANDAGLDVDPEELQELDRQRDELLDRYGPAFGFDYGWAAPLFPDLGPKERVKFGMLEELAGWAMSRYEHRLSNHQVHASARSVSLSLYEYRGQVFRLTGETNTGFAAPASMALWAVLGSAHALTFGQPEMPDPMDIVSVHTLEAMISETLGLFNAAQDELERREAEVTGEGLP
jgi:hypothetical protein